MVRKKRRSRNTEISMLNLIDVIFMLLIFFMLATTFNNYGQFKLTMPKVGTKKLDSAEKKTLEIVIDKDKNYYLRFGDSQKQITKDILENEIANIDKAMLEEVKITADEGLEYGIIMDAMGKMKNQGVKNVALHLQKSN